MRKMITIFLIALMLIPIVKSIDILDWIGSFMNNLFSTFQPCDTTADCPTGEYCYLHTHVCVTLKPEGDYCTEDYQCASGSCVNNKCSGTVSCFPNGHSCTSDSQCCSGECNLYTSQCVEPGTPQRRCEDISGTRGSCTYVQEGQSKCDSGNHFVICDYYGDGLYCWSDYGTGQCIQPTTTITTQTTTTTYITNNCRTYNQKCSDENPCCSVDPNTGRPLFCKSYWFGTVHQCAYADSGSDVPEGQCIEDGREVSGSDCGFNIFNLPTGSNLDCPKCCSGKAHTEFFAGSYFYYCGASIEDSSYVCRELSESECGSKPDCCWNTEVCLDYHGDDDRSICPISPEYYTCSMFDTPSECQLVKLHCCWDSNLLYGETQQCVEGDGNICGESSFFDYDEGGFQIPINLDLGGGGVKIDIPIKWVLIVFGVLILIILLK